MNDRSILFAQDGDGAKDGATAQAGPRGLGLHIATVVGAAILSVLLAVVVVVSQLGQIPSDQLRYLVPALLTPDMGLLPVALLIFLLISLPGHALVLRRTMRSRDSAGDRDQAGNRPPGRDAGASARRPRKGEDPGVPSQEAALGAPSHEEGIEVPLGDLAALPPEQRGQAAQALGMDWQAHYLHDDRAWLRAGTQAVTERARALTGEH